MKDNLEFLPVVSADETTHKTIATSVYHLDIGFYGLLFDDIDTAIENIMKALIEPGSDLGCGLVAYNNNVPVGYVSFFPFNQKTTKNLATIKSIIDFKLPENKQRFNESATFLHKLAPITEQGFYLNKILVFTEFQGFSFGRQIFNRYLHESSLFDLKPIFHVKRDNHMAIEFYKRQGFDVLLSGYEYVICTKT